MLGQDRAIVTPIAGTTRDTLHSDYTYYGQKITLIDTAGLRRKKYISDCIELYSTIRTMKAIEECDVALVMLDATQGMENQDAKIVNEVVEARKGAVIVVNKWDAVEKDTMTSANFEKQLRETFRTLDYIPIVFISALTHLRHTKPIEIALKVKAERKKRISTNELNGTLSRRDRPHSPARRARSRPAHQLYHASKYGTACLRLFSPISPKKFPAPTNVSWNARSVTISASKA